MIDDPLLVALARKLDEWPRGAGFAVAFSGGADSTLLLAALARLPAARPLRALHVDHGLHPDSAHWAEQCAATSRTLGVEYVETRVAVDRGSPLGLEAAARTERYRALRELLAADETLLTAHHADDQLETLLLRLLRGTGARGLRGIVEHARFGRGYLGRPLLDFTRAELRTHAERFGLAWIEDPSNRDAAHDRNYLRLHVLPALSARWPAAPRMAQRLARQMAEAGELLAARAAEDARALERLDRVPLGVLRELPASRRNNLLRYLLSELGLSTPNARQLRELVASLDVHRPDAQTRVAWPGAEARIYRSSLYLLAPLPARSAPGTSAPLSRAAAWIGPEGRVELVPTDGDGLPDTWIDAGVTVRFRAGGERFRPLGRGFGCSLKRWLHDAGIVPWMRARVPLIFRGDRLAAVADLALDESAAAPAARRYAVSWTGHPPVR